MNKCQLVRFFIENGPKWNKFRSYHGELVCFPVMKEVSLEDGQFRSVLKEPVDVMILVDHIAAPIHTENKPIRGKIVGKVPHGEVLPEFEDDIGLLALTDGMEVLVEYMTASQIGHITFEGPHASRDWRIEREIDGRLVCLNSVEEDDDKRGICCEAVYDT